MNDCNGFGVSPSRSRTASGLMLASVFLMSFIPLFVAFGGGGSPLIFNAAWVVGGFVGCALTLLIVFPRMLFSGEVWKVIVSRALSLAMLWWVVGFLNLGLYAWSTQFIDVSVAVMLYEIWPIFLVMLTAWLFRKEARYRKITANTIFPFGFAFLGIVSVIASQAGGIDAFASVDTGGVNLAIGVALAFGSMGLAAVSAFGNRWAADLASELSELPGNRERGKDRLELFGVVVGIAIRSLISLPFITSVGFMLNEPISPDALIWGATGGLFVAAVGAILWRMANLISTDLGINVMAYLAPALALFWLYAFSRVGDVDVWSLAVGAVLILGANLLMRRLRREQTQALGAMIGKSEKREVGAWSR